MATTKQMKRAAMKAAFAAMCIMSVNAYGQRPCFTERDLAGVGAEGTGGRTSPSESESPCVAEAGYSPWGGGRHHRRYRWADAYAAPASATYAPQGYYLYTAEGWRQYPAGYFSVAAGGYYYFPQGLYTYAGNGWQYYAPGYYRY